MKAGTRVVVLVAMAAIGLGAWALLPRFVSAHCDTIDGPVVTAAKAALDKGDVTPVLKWVKEPYEAEVRAAFARALSVRALSPAARELADTYFYETLVRLHRAGEGAPYTGLEPAGTPQSPAITAADVALKAGSADHLTELLTERVAAGVRERFARALEAGKHADQSVEAGREAVGAYVEFVHYAERLYDDAAAPVGHHTEAGAPEADRHVD